MGNRSKYNGSATPGNLSRSQFISKIAGWVVKYCTNSGILPSVVLGQACKESGNGNDYKGWVYNNILGHMANDSWSGDSVKKSADPKAPYWRVYPSLEACIISHIANLKQGKYKLKGVALKKTPLAQLQALQAAGYNVGGDKHSYADVIWKQFILPSNLQQFDERMFAYERELNENNLAFHEQDGITKALHNIFA